MGIVIVFVYSPYLGKQIIVNTNRTSYMIEFWIRIITNFEDRILDMMSFFSVSWSEFGLFHTSIYLV